MTYCNRILLVDDDPLTEAALAMPLRDAGLDIDAACDGMTAMQKLSGAEYAAIVITPRIRHGLNGFAVLSYIEEEQPDMLSRVFVLTVLPMATIKRLAPAVLSRSFFRTESMALVHALVEFCGRTGIKKAGYPILLVEDDAETATIEAEILHELGYSCRWVSRGSEVLTAVRSARFDALVLDMVLPDIDGIEILHALRDIDPDLLRCVVIVTGLPAQRLQEIHDYPVCGILSKPVDAQSLEFLLEKCTTH
jgi:two-component system cell cycle response regulator CpdR